MPINTTDPDELRVTGENNWMMVFEEGTDTLTTNVSVWRVQLSPAGPGHALFWRSELTGGEPKVYADNPALARWLQSEVLGAGPTAPYADPSLAIAEASFTKVGTIPWFITERVETSDEVMEFTWFDFLDPHAGHSAPDLEKGETHGHYAVYVPARQVRVTLNGVHAQGVALERDRDGWKSSTCFLALAESWTRKRQSG